MEERKTTEEEKLPLQNITARVIILSAVFFVLQFMTQLFMSIFGTKSGLTGGAISWFIYMLIFVALGKITPLLKLSVGELTYVTIIMVYVLNSGRAGWYPTGNRLLWELLRFTNMLTFSIYNNPNWVNWVPSWMFPAENRMEIAKMLLYGKTPGEIFPYAAMVSHVLYTTALMGLFMILGQVLLFGVIGPQWVDVERLTFPYAVSITYSNEKMIRTKDLFNLKIFESKVFWIFFIIGCITGITPFLMEVLPGVPIAFSFVYGSFRVDLPPIATAFPGAMAYGWFWWPQFYVGLLVPNETLFTFVLWYIVIGVLYNTIALRMGWYSEYTVGNEYTRWGVPHAQAPFPIINMMLGGGLVMSGVILWWGARSRFKRIFDAMRGNDIVEHGISLRFLGYLGIVCFIALIALLTASGMPLIIVLLYMFFYWAHNAAVARVSSEYVDHPGYIRGWDWHLMYPLGASLGYWTMTVPANYSWWFTRTVTWHLGYCCGPRTQGSAYMNNTNIYKVARDANVNLKHLLFLIIGTLALGMPLIMFTTIYFYVNGGGSTSSLLGHQQLESYGINSLVFNVSGGNFDVGYIWWIQGAIIVLIFWLAKRFLPWLPYNPYMIPAAGFNVEWYWLAALCSLVIRVIAIRMVGSRTYMRYATSIVTALLAGYAAIYLLSWLFHFSTVAWPTYLARMSA